MRLQIANCKFQIGFTLIEVTIAMTLLALMAMILYGAFYMGHRAVEKAQARSEESQRLRSVEDVLAGHIRSAYPCRPSPKDQSIFFSGEESRLTFISALSLGMGGRGMAKVIVHWTDEGDGSGSLTLEEVTPLAAGCQEGGAGYKNSMILIPRMRDFHIDYLDPQGEEERWVEQWEGGEQKALPRAVRLSHRGKRGEEAQWVFPIMMRVLGP